MHLHIFLATFVLYLCTFFMNIKGVRSLSIASVLTYFFPFITLIAIAIKGFSLDGAKEGLSRYFNGDPDVEWAPFKDFGIWADAFNQAYFTTGFCTGTMVALGSFKKKEEPLIKSIYGLIFWDFINYIIYGMAVFTLVGYLSSVDSPVASKARILLLFLWQCQKLSSNFQVLDSFHSSCSSQYSCWVLTCAH